MKILQLQKDNQSLTHEIELTRLKASHESESRKGMAERELEKKLVDKDREMAAKENEFNLKIKELENQYNISMNEKDVAHQGELTKMKNQMFARENKFKLELYDKKQEMSAKENELLTKIKLMQTEKEKELTIQVLRYKIEMMEARGDENLKKDSKPHNAQAAASANLPGKVVITKEDKLIWGVDKFFLGMQPNSNIFDSYQHWYENISGMLENKTQECVTRGTKHYFFIKKEMHQQFSIMENCFPSYQSEKH